MSRGFLRGFYPLGTFRGIYVFWTVWGIFFWLFEPVRLLAWKGSFIRCFTGSEAGYTLISELYAPVAYGEKRITDMNNVQRAFCLSGRFLYTKFFNKFCTHPNISLTKHHWQDSEKHFDWESILNPHLRWGERNGVLTTWEQLHRCFSVRAPRSEG